MSRLRGPGTFWRVRRTIHVPRTTNAGAQTQARLVMTGSPGENASRATPEAARTAAGTYAHRCGRVVSRVVSQASIAQAAPNAVRAAPTIVASEASGRTANVRAAATMAPVAIEEAMMRPSGPLGVAGMVELAGVGVRVEVLMTVPFRAALQGLEVGTTVAVTRSGRPGHMAGVWRDTDRHGRTHLLLEALSPGKARYALRQLTLG